MGWLVSFEAAILTQSGDLPKVGCRDTSYILVPQRAEITHGLPSLSRGLMESWRIPGSLPVGA